MNHPRKRKPEVEIGNASSNPSTHRCSVYLGYAAPCKLSYNNSIIAATVRLSDALPCV
jgi:hypothetical protein